MLYKNKIKVQNILKRSVALMLMLTLSLSTTLSPLAKAEEARHTWKTSTSVPVSNPSNMRDIYVSSDGSKLFIREEDSSSHNASFWMSADDGATWKKIWSKQLQDVEPSFSADGSKIVLSHNGSIYMSTDGGQNWTEKGPDPRYGLVRVSPDGSFLVGCSGTNITGYTFHISTDDGQNWTQKGTNTNGCPQYVTNNGTMIVPDNAYGIEKSTDYGQTWTRISNFSSSPWRAAFSNNGNNVFDGNRISLDGGNHWTPSNAPISLSDNAVRMGISEDGKKLFIYAESTSTGTIFMSVDGGRTWRTEHIGLSIIDMSNDGSKLFNVYEDNNGRLVYRVGTLPTAQPVTPGSGAGGTVTPSTGSTSATPGQKPGKASGRLAETGISVQLIGGLAVVAVAAGALVLRKRL